MFICQCVNAHAAELMEAKSLQEHGNRLTTIFRAARKVMSDNQQIINDDGAGFKGVTAQSILRQVEEAYQLTTETQLDLSALSESEQLLIRSIKEVINNNQQLINEKGIGFKGFLPAIFAGQVAYKFNKLTKGKITIKLTAPADYIRNPRNAPDSWETHVIEEFFKAKKVPKGQVYSEESSIAGKKAFRLILPEYYEASCLVCHGTPKGSLDITGSKKEGGKLYQLGGAISLVIYK